MSDQRVEVAVSGKNLAQASLWTNLRPSPTIEPADDGKNKDTRKFKLRPAPDTPLGIYALRLMGPAGLSNVALFMVDDLSTLRESGEHASQSEAQDIPLSIAIEGAAEREASDFFSFTADADQRVSIEVVARRFGSPMDPMLRVLDERGRELAFADDDASTGADPRVSFVPPKAGRYWIEVRDSRYDGGKEHRYRLRVGNFPLVSAAYPLAVNPKNHEFPNLVSSKREPMEFLVSQLPELNEQGEHTLRAQFLPTLPSSLVRILVSDGFEQLEAEPNDARDSATPIETTGAINGCLQTLRDRDYYRIALKRDRRIVLTSTTRSLGAPTHLRLRLFDPHDKLVADADDEGIDEPSLAHVAAVDGEYRLLVEELFGQGGPDHVYRLELCVASSDFALSAETDRYNASPGESFTVKVSANRSRFKGPINLILRGDNVSDWKLSDETIAEGKNETSLKITLPKRYEVGDVVPFEVLGTATIDKRPVSIAVSVLSPLREELNGLRWPPSDLTHALWVGVMSHERSSKKKE
ncbi:MAG TPA: PPC domain-containing protein [Pirellulales bacterium]|nr:PPC domain-containing protein [Pirellulales bacterium]